MIQKKQQKLDDENEGMQLNMNDILKPYKEKIVAKEEYKKWFGISTVHMFLIALLLIIGSSIVAWFILRLRLNQMVNFVIANKINFSTQSINYSDLVDKTIEINRAFTDHFVSIFSTCIGPLIPILSVLIGYVWGQKSQVPDNDKPEDE